ncbi:para-nitrobenzyl esterase [Streptacidiphilus sp. MAP12-20]|uniref:carboxylesterase/lipase family protein n=1 Tax=Streptacidiphilus sp. MAP12-20 TaxID=3156299 RepID=UPI0035159096
MSRPLRSAAIRSPWRPTRRPARWALASAATALSLLLLPMSSAGASAVVPATVATAQGAVQGVVTAAGSHWLGLPYAAPPTGSRRWKPPAAAASWSGVRPATSPAPACLQDTTDYAKGRGSEDCLYLNVYAPPGTATDSRLPVIVWMHGGGFVNGSGGDWDGTSLAQTANAIVVTINYRLGPFGWLALDSLSAEQNGASGNYGLMDQAAAFAWVKNNIAAFGGDGGNVTIAGQSAGAESVFAQLVSPGSAGLFQKAISMSAPTAVNLPTAAAASQRNNSAYATELGCTDAATQVACLRAVPAAQALAAGHESWNLIKDLGLYWTPVVGVPTLPDQWLTLYKNGAYTKVPIIVGSTHDEGQLFTAIYENNNGHALTLSELVDRGSKFLGVATPVVLAKYNPLTYGSNSAAMSAVMTDALFACGQGRVRDALATGGTPVYSYEFTDPHAFEVNVHGQYSAITDAHDADLPFLFQSNPADIQPPTPAFSPDQRALAVQIGQYWGAFARTGDPNSAGLPAWPSYVAGTSTPTQSLTPPAAVTLPSGQYYDRHNCGMWNTILDLKALSSPS